MPGPALATKEASMTGLLPQLRPLHPCACAKLLSCFMTWQEVGHDASVRPGAGQSLAAGRPQDSAKREHIMIVRRRTWLYRMPGENAIHSVSFKLPMTTAQAREALRRSVGSPLELWGRSLTDRIDAGI